MHPAAHEQPPTDATHLSFHRVTKFYGPVIGVNDITCRLGPGITALFGANGAGKSTLMKLASGQLRPTQGDVRVGPYRAWSSRAKRLIGFCPDLNRFYEEMTGRQFVFTMARLSGYTLREARERTERALDEVGMTSRAQRKLAGCSHGMRQRIKLAQAIVHDPPLLLLDEPTAGIDPGGRHEVGKLLDRQAELGRTILVSTHILREVEDLADSILVIAAGRMIASGTLSEVRNLLDDQPFTVRLVCDDYRRLAASLVEMSEVQSIDLRPGTIMVRTTNPPQFFAALRDAVVDQELELRHVEVLDTGADAVFDYLQEGAA